MSWPVVPFLSVCDFQGGTQPPKSTFIDEHQEGYIRLLQIQDFKRSDKQVFIPFKSTLKTCKENDILIARYGASIGKILSGLSGAYNVALTKTIPNLAKLDRKYLYYFLVSDVFQSFILNVGSRAAQAGFNKEDFNDLKIPLPPRSTQKQIAAILEKADQLRKDCQQMEEELNNLAQSVFIDIFGDPVSNPKGWETLPLSSIVDDFLGGKSLAASEDEATNFKNRVAKISAVTSGEFKSYESKPLPNDYEPPEAHYIKNGDFLFSRANTTELVGATAMVFSTPNNIVLPDKLWRFIWKTDVKLSSVFIWKLLSFPSQRVEISKLSSGSGGSMKNISKEKLNTLNIIFPPAHLQEKYEAFYLALRAQIEEQKINAIENEKLFSSLISKAFNGELNLKNEAA